MSTAKSQKKSKKMKDLRRTKRKVILGIIFALTVGFYLIAIYTLPAFTIYSDDNTESFTGRVTSVYVDSQYTGFKSRKRSMICVELDTGETFHISNLTLRKNHVEFESLKETILNNNVEIQAATSDTEKIVTIRCEDEQILTYENLNQTSQSNRIGLLVVCCVSFAFVALLLLL